MILFIAAMFAGGLGLMTFFNGLERLFAGTRARIPAAVGSVSGSIAGVFFWGVTACPADLLFHEHFFFVTWAYRFFLLAALCTVVCLLNIRRFPFWVAGMFIGFTCLLIAYLGLLSRAGEIDTAQEFVIQVIGQKVIVYSSIIIVLITSLYALMELKDSSLSTDTT